MVGVGNLGEPMARRLLAAGFPLAVHDADEGAVADLVAAGARHALSAADVARSADVVLVVVRTAEQVEAVCFGPTGIAGAAAPGCLVCIVSTIALSDLERIAGRAADVGLDVVDTAVGGGSPAAAAGTLTAMVGGTAAQADRATAVFQAFCGDIIHVPGVGGGMRLKLVKNHLSYLSMAMASEATDLAAAAAIDIELVRRVVDSSDLVNQFLLANLGRDTTPLSPVDAASVQTATAMAELCEKDLAAALEVAAQSGLDLPIAALVEGRARPLFRVPGEASTTPAPVATRSGTA